MNGFIENKCKNFLYHNFLNEGDKFQEQFMRNIRQIKSDMDTVHSINTGNGVSQHLGVNVTTFQEEVVLDDSEMILLELLKQCKEKNYAISIIENCLLIGVYNTQKFPDRAFDFWVSELGIETPIYDLRHSFSDPSAQPIFLHSFSTNDLVAIVNGKIIIKMAIDINAWLSSLEQEGYTYRWLTKKETARLKSKYKSNLTIFEVNKKAIEIKKGDFEMILGGGLFVRMFTMFNTPSSIKKYIIETDKHTVASPK